MAGDDPRLPNTPIEERLLRRFRVITLAVVLFLIGMLAIVDTVGKILISPEFHTSELFFGTLVGALLGLLGVEVINRLPVGRNGK